MRLILVEIHAATLELNTNSDVYSDPATTVSPP